MEQNKTRYHIFKTYLDKPLLFKDFCLMQIGRRYCSANEIIPVHPHLNWFELTIVTHGHGTIITNGTQTQVKAGDIYLSFPCDLHELRASEKEGFEYDFLSFYTTNEDFNNKLHYLTKTKRDDESRILRDEKINYLVGNAILEFSVENIYQELSLTNIFQQILVYLLRAFNERQNEKTNVSSSDILCFQIMNYIDTHLYEINDLKSIALHFNYNYSYLSALFKRTTGKNISNYYNHRRLESAKAFVLEQKKKISEIAEILHYNSVFSLSKAFKMKYGRSPKNMQKENDEF